MNANDIPKPDLGAWVEMVRSVQRYSLETFGVKASAVTLHVPELDCDAKLPLSVNLHGVAMSAAPARPATVQAPTPPPRTPPDNTSTPRPVKHPVGTSSRKPSNGHLSDAEIAERIAEARAEQARKNRTDDEEE